MFTFSQSHLLAQLDLPQKCHAYYKSQPDDIDEPIFTQSKHHRSGSTELARICSKLVRLVTSHGQRISTSLFSLSQSATDLQNKISVPWRRVKRPTGRPALSAEGTGVYPTPPTCEGGTSTRTSLLAALISFLSVARMSLFFHRLSSSPVTGRTSIMLYLQGVASD